MQYNKELRHYGLRVALLYLGIGKQNKQRNWFNAPPGKHAK